MAGEPLETHPENSTQHDDRSLVVAILLIAVGVVWLLSNLGAINAPDVGQIVRLWPLILVYLGVKRLLER